MIIGIGTDLLDCRRLEKSISAFGQRFLDRLFTNAEQKKCQGRKEVFQSYGKIFAAKESVLKAIGDTEGVRWQDIELNHLPNGKPTVTLSGRALENLKKQIQSDRPFKFDVSISDDPPYAIAFVVISC
ncbi:MAG: holo-ACP synthase [Alphaproteobacteria bacterium]|nr:holo-ACP synthase [Alphaproteobacteria bacterium]